MSIIRQKVQGVNAALSAVLQGARVNISSLNLDYPWIPWRFVDLVSVFNNTNNTIEMACDKYSMM